MSVEIDLIFELVISLSKGLSLIITVMLYLKTMHRVLKQILLVNNDNKINIDRNTVRTAFSL